MAGRILALATVVLLLAVPASAQPAAVQPDPSLTPGEIASSDPAVVCRRGYSRAVRDAMPRGLRASVYRAYGIGRSDHRFVIDHRVPLGLGGADTAANMWPEPKAGPMNSYVKDGLEDLLHWRVCGEHLMSLEAAQRVFLGDWIAAWHASASRRRREGRSDGRSHSHRQHGADPSGRERRRPIHDASLLASGLHRVRLRDHSRLDAAHLPRARHCLGDAGRPDALAAAAGDPLGMVEEWCAGGT